MTQKFCSLIGRGLRKTDCDWIQSFLSNHIQFTKDGPEVIKPFSCSTKLSTKFQLLIKLKYRQMKKFFDFSLSVAVFIMLINVKMPTIVGILTCMSSRLYMCM